MRAGRNRFRREDGKRLAALLTAAALAAETAVPAYAAPPRVQVDETMYVNLDYYGEETQVNVVKGCSTNGVTEYTDYGSYDRVVNMTDDAKPSLGDGSVTWTFPDENRRFYYQCTLPNGQAELPWNFDISYKLNGVETEPEKLNGASGLIEIRIRALPNRKAKAYFRNNMMLLVAVPADLSACYSVDAPGAQLQSIGDMSAAVFMALPGEEGDYTVRLGTDSFESVGIVMMMAPGTADAFDHIAELKEAKDTWREDGDALYESLDDILEAFEAMEGGVQQLQGGMDRLEQGRRVLSGSRRAIEEGSSQALNDLASVTEQTSKLISYLQTARSAVTDINDNARAIYNTMGDMQDELDDLYDRLKSLRNSLNSASGQIETGITAAQQQAIAQEIQETSRQIEEILAALGQMGAGAGNSRQAALEEWEELNRALEAADAFRYDRGSGEKQAADGEEREGGEESRAEETDRKEKSKTEEKNEKKGVTATESDARAQADSGGFVRAFSEGEKVPLRPEEEILPLPVTQAEEESGLTAGPSGEPGSGGDNDEDFEEWQEWQDEELSGYADAVEADLQTLSGSAYQADVGALLEMVKNLIGSSDETVAAAGALIQRINGLCASLADAGEDTAKVLNELRGCTDQLVNLLDDSRVLIDTMDSYVPSMLDALGATEELMNRLTRAMGSAESFLRTVNDTLTAAGDSLDGGAQDTIAGIQGLLGRSLEAIEGLKAVRTAGRDMKDTLDGQLDKYEEENNFLNMDPEASFVSFTSGKNPSPHSIQIVLRTEEIDDEAFVENTEDLEAASEQNEGPLKRIWNVIVEIVRAVAGVFKKM